LGVDVGNYREQQVAEEFAMLLLLGDLLCYL
jgi:hypothetical protein